MEHLIKIFIFFFAFNAFATIIPERDEKNRVIQRSAGIHSDHKSHVRFTGTHDFSIAGNQTTSASWLIPQLQVAGVDVVSIMQGVQYKTIGGCDGDKVKFEVTHPVAGVVETFADSFYVFKDEINTIKEHRTSLPAGLSIKVTYTSTCATAARFICNVYRYAESE